MSKIEIFLKKCGLRNSINAFSDHNIKMHRVTSLSERELEVLFPIIGDRQSFKAAIKRKRIQDIIRKRKREAGRWIVEKLIIIKKTRMRSNGTKKQAKGITKKTPYPSTSHSRNVVRHIFETNEAATSALIEIVDKILTSHSESLKVDGWRDLYPEKELIDFEKGKLNCPVCPSQITPYLRKVSPIKWKAHNYRRHLEKFHADLKESCEEHDFAAMMVDVVIEAEDSNDDDDWSDSDSLALSSRVLKESNNERLSIVDTSLPNINLSNGMPPLQSGQAISKESLLNDSVPNDSLPVIQPPNEMHEQHSSSIQSSADDQQQLQPGEPISIDSQSNDSLPVLQPPTMYEQHSLSFESFAVDPQKLQPGEPISINSQPIDSVPNDSLQIIQPPNGMYEQNSPSTQSFSDDQQQLQPGDPISIDSQPSDSLPVIQPPDRMYEQHSSSFESFESFADDPQKLQPGEAISINSQPNDSVPNDSLQIIQPPNGMYEQNSPSTQSFADDQQQLQPGEPISIDSQPSDSRPLIQQPDGMYEHPLRPGEPISDRLELPLNEYTDDGYRCYSKLMRGDLPVHLGDTVYILRDIQLSGTLHSEFTSMPGKHTYKTIGEIDHTECDIFRVEQMWKDSEGNRFVFGHHYLRPCETFHKAAKKFFHNELVKASMYEKLSIDLIMGRCWVLDPKIFCKGRPIDSEELHVYICELKVNKGRRIFSKISKQEEYPLCTKSIAFKTFDQELKITRNYSPHHVNNTNKKGVHSIGAIE